MRRILHLSDLHFGRIRPDLTEPLLQTIHRLDPHLVVVSGDLTQRARWSQFRAAKAFLDRIGPPVMTVPGNHDVPLDNLWVRLLRPFSRYKKVVIADMHPVWKDEELNVIGVNTVNPFAWQSGRIRSKAVRRVCSAFDPQRHGRRRIVVLHHPLNHAPGTDKKLMRGAERAVAQLAECGADIVLCGHLHAWRAEPHSEGSGRAATLLVQAGTGLSTRLRGEENDFNLLTVDGAEVTVDRWAAPHHATTFERCGSLGFRRDGTQWHRLGDARISSCNA
jgi:3',5'-cyclic AMP phosphodiesterase CpdA